MSEQKIRTENGIEAAQFDSSKTIKRARWESFQIAPCPETGKINVCNQSHAEEEQMDHTYTVTVEDSIPTHCTCKSYEYRQGNCKHCLAVLADSDAMNVAEHGHEQPTAEASESNKVAMTDGGRSLDDYVDLDDVLDEIEETEEPEETEETEETEELKTDGGLVELATDFCGNERRATCQECGDWLLQGSIDIGEEVCTSCSALDEEANT